MARPQVWIGLVAVKPLTKTALPKGAQGAFANALAKVSSEKQFTKLVTAALREYELAVVHVKEVEPWEQRIQSFEVNPEIRALAEMVEREGGVRFDEFHTYRKTEKE